MVKGFFISGDPAELIRAVLVMAYHAKGGITEWLEMDSSEFPKWMAELKELTHGK